MKKILLLQIFATLYSLANAQCNLLTNALPGMTLVHQNTNCFNNSGVAFNPNLNVYYGVRAGNPSFPLETWSLVGAPLYNTTAGFDWRGMWWNPTTNQLEGNGYNTSGIWKADLNASGYALNTGTTIFSGMNQPDAQSCGDLDWQAYEVLYYFNGSIYRYSRSTNAFLGSYPITGTPTALSDLNSTTLMYTGCTGKEIALLDYNNRRVYVYNKANGAYVGMSQLPASAVTSGSFRTSWANCYVWLFNLANYTWYSYQIFDACASCPPVYTNFTPSICTGDSIHVGGSWQHISGTYYDTLTAVSGCDSILINTLTVIPLSIVNQNHTICNGDSIHLGGAWQHISGTYSDTLTASTGCDSVVISQLTILQNYAVSQTRSICNGDSLLLGGAWQHIAGMYVDSLNTTAGCDSILTTTLLVNPIYNFNKVEAICQGDQIFLGGQWQTNPGIYIDHYTSVKGCDSSISTVLSVNPLPFVNLGNDKTLCEGETLILDATTPNVSYQWQDNSANPTFTVTQTGTYWVEVDQNNCKYKDSIHVVFNEVPIVNLGPNQSLCPDRTITLDATTGNATYIWQDNTTKPTYIVSTSGNYWVKVTELNCASSDTIHIDFDNPDCGCPVFIPNAFSPNNDTKNDEFRLMNTYGVDLKDFRIFNRWGEVVFKTQAIFDSWNGNYKGAPSEEGTYFYYVKYTCRYNHKEYILKGDITLIR